MPERWLHEAFDFYLFGRSFWRVHKFKDEPSTVLGTDHRYLRHHESEEWLNYLRDKHGFGLKNPKAICPLYKAACPLCLMGRGIIGWFDDVVSDEEAASLYHERLDENWSKATSEQKHDVAMTMARWALGFEVLPRAATVKDRDNFCKLREHICSEVLPVLMRKILKSKAMELIQNKIEGLRAKGLDEDKIRTEVVHYADKELLEELVRECQSISLERQLQLL